MLSIFGGSFDPRLDCYSWFLNHSGNVCVIETFVCSWKGWKPMILVFDWTWSAQHNGLVLTDHSLGAGTAVLLGVLLHESVTTFNELVSTTLGIYPKMIVCWGLGCLPCMDHGVVQVLMFVSNAVLQVWP
jgi:hypothetical protein